MDQQLKSIQSRLTLFKDILEKAIRKKKSGEYFNITQSMKEVEKLKNSGFIKDPKKLKALEDWYDKMNDDIRSGKIDPKTKIKTKGSNKDSGSLIEKIKKISSEKNLWDKNGKGPHKEFEKMMRDKNQWLTDNELKNVTSKLKTHLDDLKTHSAKGFDVKAHDKMAQIRDKMQDLDPHALFGIHHDKMAMEKLGIHPEDDSAYLDAFGEKVKHSSKSKAEMRELTSNLMNNKLDPSSMDDDKYDDLVRQLKQQAKVGSQGKDQSGLWKARSLLMQLAPHERWGDDDYHPDKILGRHVEGYDNMLSTRKQKGEDAVGADVINIKRGPTKVARGASVGQKMKARSKTKQTVSADPFDLANINNDTKKKKGSKQSDANISRDKGLKLDSPVPLRQIGLEDESKAKPTTVIRKKLIKSEELIKDAANPKNAPKDVKVKQLQQQIDAGTYKPDPKKIAGKMVERSVFNKNGQWSLEKMSNYGPKKMKLYDPKANVKRKMKNVEENILEGPNKNTKKYTTTGSTMGQAQAAASAKQQAAANKKAPVKRMKDLDPKVLAELKARYETKKE